MTLRTQFVPLFIAACLGMTAAGISALRAAPQAVGQALPAHVDPAAPSAPSAEATFIATHCIGCHNDRTRTAGFSFGGLNPADVSVGAGRWETVIRKLRSGAMPPPGRPRPPQANVQAFVSHLERSLDRVAALDPNPGRTETFHRLNRAEYRNAVRDLLGLEVDVTALLPADGADRHGFDNIASVLSISPTLVERYMSAARTVSQLVVGLPSRPSIQTYRVPINTIQEDRLSEDLPFGSRGGIAVRHYFPADGEYVIKVALHANYVEYIRGLESPHQLDVRLDGQRVKQFVVGGARTGKPAPISFAGNIFGDPEWEKYSHEADAGLELRLPLTAGSRTVGVSFLRERWEPEGILQPRQFAYALSVNEMADGNPAVASVAISGPFDSRKGRKREKFFVCQPTQPDDVACATRILKTLATRAYRRPATNADVDTLLAFYRQGQRGAGFDAGIQAALERLLIDPEFLLRIEPPQTAAPPSTNYRISDLELASRLSFFLWSSIPDDELLMLGAQNKLKDERVLERQVRRMLADPRAKALIDNFVGQWLLLRTIRTASPDSATYPEFDDNLRDAFHTETEMFVGSVMTEDRSVVDLLSADYTFVNERLARHYGLPGVYGSRFRKVTLTNGERMGLLGHGSVLTATSYPNRTSPVLRGKFLLENILGTPPPPPPPDIPALPDRGEGGKPASVRDRLEQHRKNPSCAACHAPMDPLGFALQNFDGIGMWRSHEAGTAIDASGNLPTGAAFSGPAGLRSVLLREPEMFVRTMTEKLLMYALGRGIEHYDMPVVRRIAADAAPSQYRWSAIVLGIVKSTPFQMKRSPA